MTSTATMRAIRQEALGSPDVLKEVVIPRPDPGPGQLLVGVRAAGLNPTDWKNRASVATVDRLPLILGWDVSGVVEAVGLGVTLFKSGDEVFGMLPYPSGAGSHAEYVTGPARCFVHKPAIINHVQAGALPLAALTAYQAIVDTADVRAGQRVLVHAAAGGVGHLAVQIAKSRGAYVIGTASAAKHDFLRAVGADEAIDYRTVDIVDAVADVDVVLDSVSIDAHDRARSLRVLRPGGTLVSLLPVPMSPGELAQIAESGVRFEPLVVEADHAGMQAIAGLVESQVLRAHVEATFPLAEAAKAHAIGEAGRVTGKIVLTVEGTGNHEIAERTLRGVFASGDTSVVDRHVRSDYIQHNPLAPDGPEAMKAFGAAWRQQFPDAAYDLKRAICEGDFVLLHSHGVTTPGTRGLAIFDIFRFEDGMIAEHWDILQEVPERTANGNDMFSTVSEPPTGTPRERWLTAYNRKIVTDFVDEILVRKELNALDRFVGSGYHEHDPHIPDGAPALKSALGTYFAQFPQLSVTPKRVIAEGDLVAVHSHYVSTPDDRGKAVIDLFRVRNGQIVEHWNAAQDVPESAANGNTMF